MHSVDVRVVFTVATNTLEVGMKRSGYFEASVML